MSAWPNPSGLAARALDVGRYRHQRYSFGAASHMTDFEPTTVG